MSTKGRRNRPKRNRARGRAERSSANAQALESLTPSPLPVSVAFETLEFKTPTLTTAPSVGDFDTRFFESSSSDAWLAHELELRDPRFVRKMTAVVARRRAHLAKYVVGVVAIAAALGLAALLKSAVVPHDDEQNPRPHRPAAVGKTGD
jgi:hypothetical protein